MKRKYTVLESREITVTRYWEYEVEAESEEEAIGLAMDYDEEYEDESGPKLITTWEQSDESNSDESEYEIIYSGML